MSATAKHTNYHQVMSSKHLTRIALGENLLPGIPPDVHSAIVMENNNASEMAVDILTSLYDVSYPTKSINISQFIGLEIERIEEMREESND